MTDETTTTWSDEGWLDRAAELHGDRIALEWPGGGRWSYEELHRAVGETVDWLGAAGVGPGDGVALLASNGPAWARMLHAVASIGATLLPLNLRLAPEELAFQLDDACVTRCVIGAGVDESQSAGLLAQWPRGTMLEVDAMGAPTSVGPRVPAAASFVAAAIPAVAVAPAASVAPAVSVTPAASVTPAVSVTPAASLTPAAAPRPLAVLYTSGTTGRPKGVCLPARSFSASAEASQHLLPLGPGDRWLVCMPLFHVGGLSILVRAALSGATAVVHAGFDEGAVAAAIGQEGVTHLSLVPTMLGRLLEARGDVHAPEGLCCVLLGGAAAPPGLIERAWSLGYPIAPTYGLTEACSQVATRVAGDRGLPVAGRLVPLPGTEVVVRDATGRERATAAEGEILVRGSTLATGFVGHAAGKLLVDERGWLATGDVGRIDEMGRLEVLDRRDDLIVSGGENVYPAEIERVLLEHPAVAEVAVVARADARFGARPVAFWVRCVGGVDPGESGLAEAARRRLAGYKVPVAFIEVDALPRTASGKVRRVLLRARAGREAGAGQV